MQVKLADDEGDEGEDGRVKRRRSWLENIPKVEVESMRCERVVEEGTDVFKQASEEIW